MLIVFKLNMFRVSNYLPFFILLVFFSNKGFANISCKRTFENYNYIKLLEYSRTGNIEQIKRLSNQVTDLNFLTYEDKTPLMVMAENGNIEAAEVLLSLGSLQINKTNSYGKTALTFAVENRHKDFALFLIKNKANVNPLQRELYRTPLMWAVYNQDKEMVQLLVDSGANPHASNKHGETAFTIAIMKRAPELVAILLKTINKSLFNYLEVHLMLAVKKEDVDIANLLIAQGAEVNRRMTYGKKLTTFLIEAILSENKNIILLLLNKNADVNSRDTKGETPIMLMAQTGNIEIFQILADRGANITEINNNGDTVLNIAIKAGHKAIVQFLIDKGVSITNASVRETPLMIAIKNKREEIVQVLIEAGVDMEAVRNGDTALLTAVKHNQFGAFKLLLENGADASVRDSYGKTVWDLALKHEYTEIFKLLPEDQRVKLIKEKERAKELLNQEPADLSDQIPIAEVIELPVENIVQSEGYNRSKNIQSSIKNAINRFDLNKVDMTKKVKNLKDHINKKFLER